MSNTKIGKSKINRNIYWNTKRYIQGKTYFTKETVDILKIIWIIKPSTYNLFVLLASLNSESKCWNEINLILVKTKNANMFVKEVWLGF